MASTNLTEQYYDLHEHAHPDGYSTTLGFWIYLMSDCLIFGMLFATYAVLGGNYAGVRRPRICSTCRWWRSTPRCCSSRRSPMALP
jgi:cytochrome o ubiquinol oxidase subunit 3